MIDESEATDRLDAVEIRIAHLDAVIEDLNGVITAQWARIEALTRQQARLDDRVRDAESRTGTPQAPPPHY